VKLLAKKLEGGDQPAAHLVAGLRRVGQPDAIRT
jgi:hypothetical protein